MNTEKIWSLVLSKPGKFLFFLFWALLVTNLWLPRNWSFYGGNDWDLTYSMFEAARICVVDYHQWPVYNPFSSFGYDIVADPQAGQFSIFFIPILLFGTFYGYKLSIVMALVIGCFGANKLFYCINPDKKLSLLAALMFCASGYFSAHIFQAGHSNVLYLYLLPWLLIFMVKLREKYHFKYIIFSSLVLAQMIIGGAPIVFLISVAIIKLWLICDIWVEKKIRHIVPFLMVVISAVLLSFWKILPGIQLWAENPRLVDDESGISLLQWIQTLGGYNTRTGTWHGWWEYVLGFNLVLLGIIYYYRKNIHSWWKLLVLAGAVIWLCMGNAPELMNPWYWLNKYVPVFSSLRAPSRFGFIILLALFVALIYVTKNATEKKLLYAIFVFAAFAQSLSYRADAGFIEGSPMMEVSEVTTSPNPGNWLTIVLPKGETNKQFLHLLNREMVLNAYQPLALPQVSDTMKTLFGGVEKVHYTPTKITLFPNEKKAIINQRYSKFWELEGSGKVSNHNGLLSVENTSVKATLSYRNPYILKGILWGLLLIPVLVILHYFRPKKISVPG
jgi:hypothetical protein